ncbi:MAG: hypothetical protein GX130_01435 [Candidatus Hydrogenedens sp.]|jgi:hypothetical protein|nr:hypothetical protein [Candidatus Hydrogenedens sp.]
MKKFRSIEDVDRANLPEGLRKAVRGTLTTLIDAYAEIGKRYSPELDGHTVLIEAGDTAEAETPPSDEDKDQSTLRQSRRIKRQTDSEEEDKSTT